MKKRLSAIFVAVVVLFCSGSLFAQEIDPETGRIDPETGCELWTVVGGPHRVSNDPPTTLEKLLEKYVLMKDLIGQMGYDFDVVYARAKSGVGIQKIEYTAEEAPIYKKSTYSLDQKTPRLTSNCVKPNWTGKQPLWHQTFNDLGLPPLDTYINCSNTSASSELKTITLDVPRPEPIFKLGVTKLVLNLTKGEGQFQEETRADPLDRVRYQMTLSTDGSNAVQDDVLVHDFPETRLIYTPGTLQVNGIAIPLNESDFFRAASLNLGSLPPGLQPTITFDASIAGPGSFSAGSSHVLANVFYASSKQVSEQQASARVIVSVRAITEIIAPPPPPYRPPYVPPTPRRISKKWGLLGLAVIPFIVRAVTGGDSPLPQERAKSPGTLCVGYPSPC